MFQNLDRRLKKFRAQIRSEDLPCFQHLAGGYEAEFYCREIRRAGAAGKRSGLTRIRNKRFAALQKLIQGGEYFSEDCMRSRDPLLYEQCIGQYLTDEEVLERGSRAGSEPGSLADLLLSSYQEGLIQRRLERQQERALHVPVLHQSVDSKLYTSQCFISGEYFSEDCMRSRDPLLYEQCIGQYLTDEEVLERGSRADTPVLWEPGPEEKALLREEFLGRMHQRFLEGKDQDFNYRLGKH
ncbi:UNVERIFIED_CONTAM: hypothetical protein FKN15_051826 [Acipenser sinensis]